ncbi:MAG: epoxide hydrolase 1 [SAR86 cluster bacterium SAR86A]|uniref:Epoxide hydrolase 1 n=1 Tax=SAR86 cluster bacterium SAR86A TaxID=1123866 RepID=J4KS11_9GAMM|nr:MAG: epoxide hydrolase 1 [SAR86 cluster bacterium SAR86A]
MRKTIDINFIKDQNYLMISEFNIAVSDDEIDLLKHKIELTRWPDEINNKWSHGTDLNFLKSFCHTWQNDFDWRKHENKINETGSFRFTSDSGLKIHFLHSKSNTSNSLPIVMTHGWPGSVQEFLKIIPMLHKAAPMPIDIICPSLPGFGFSDKPTEPGMNSKEIAKIQHELVLALGYKKYVVQGGDWGATVSKWMAELYPEHCIGIHSNMVLAWPPADKDPSENVTDQEQKLMSNYERYKQEGFGYYEIQKTKPQTIGYGLNDSPVGLAAWIVEKFYGWFDGEDNKLVVSNDEVLAIISLYWFTQSITSSARLYKENGDLGFSFEKIKQPMAGAVFKRDLIASPRAWAEEIYNVVQWNIYDGGHFAALEQPESLSKDIIEFIKKLKI